MSIYLLLKVPYSSKGTHKEPKTPFQGDTQKAKNSVPVVLITFLINGVKVDAVVHLLFEAVPFVPVLYRIHRMIADRKR